MTRPRINSLAVIRPKKSAKYFLPSQNRKLLPLVSLVDTLSLPQACLHINQHSFANTFNTDLVIKRNTVAIFLTSSLLIISATGFLYLPYDT